MKRLIIDLDDTISKTENGDYKNAAPNTEIIAKLHKYREIGFEIVISSSRNMRTYEGNLGKINANTLPVVIEWLDRNKVPYDEIYMGKPWCGFSGFYVDDKAIRPNEFLNMSYEEIAKLINAK